MPKIDTPFAFILLGEETIDGEKTYEAINLDHIMRIVFTGINGTYPTAAEYKCKLYFGDGSHRLFILKKNFLENVVGLVDKKSDRNGND